MKKILPVLLILSAFAAACHERKSAPEAAPDYGASKAASERAHDSLDREGGSR